MATKQNNSKAQTDKKSDITSGLHRSETNRIIAGVAGGLGEYFNVDPILVRIVFILLTIFNGIGLILYLILWVIIPSQSHTTTSGSDQVRKNVDEMQDQAARFAQDFRFSHQAYSTRQWWGAIIIGLGILFFLGNFGLLNMFQIDRFWPVLLIIIGLAILFR